MLRFALLCGLVALVAAECDHMNIIKVKTQWAQAYGDNDHRDDFGQALWRAILLLEPQAENLFHRVHGDDVTSPEFKAHSARVLGSLDMTIALMDDQTAFDAQLSHLHEQHLERNIPNQYFDAFEKALQAVVNSALGQCYDESAWHECYQVIANGIHG